MIGPTETFALKDLHMPKCQNCGRECEEYDDILCQTCVDEGCLFDDDNELDDDPDDGGGVEIDVDGTIWG